MQPLGCKHVREAHDNCIVYLRANLLSIQTLEPGAVGRSTIKPMLHPEVARPKS
jgi:hypothetical protein